MTVFNRSQAHRQALSLRTMSALATVFFIAGATLPSLVFRLVVSASQAATPTGDSNEQVFLTENDVAMNRMMTDMTVKPSGDVNRDFVDMMIPHHQGAIDMARALLAHGDNETLRRIAQEIVVTQQQEIVAMRLAVGEPARPTASSGTAMSPTTGSAPGGMSGMRMSSDSMKMK